MNSLNNQDYRRIKKAIDSKHTGKGRDIKYITAITSIRLKSIVEVKFIYGVDNTAKLFKVETHNTPMAKAILAWLHDK